MHLETEPGLNYAYSNLGAGLLGHTLGLSQKTSFQELLQQQIFDKFEMSNSFTSNQNLEGKLVLGLSESGEPESNWSFDVLFGGGGILSTTEDLAKFVISQVDPNCKEFVLATKPTFTVGPGTKIGLGWHLLKSKSDNDLVWHNGGTAGYTSSMTIDMDSRTTVIVLSNVSAFSAHMDNIDSLGKSLLSNYEK